MIIALIIVVAFALGVLVGRELAFWAVGKMVDRMFGGVYGKERQVRNER